MSITDELRKYANRLSDEAARKSEHGFSPVAMALEAIADRIDDDAEDNERFRREAEPFCDRLRGASAERADVTLFGVEYTALPLDADGVPIRVGDVIAYEGNTKPKEVVALVPPSVVMVEDGPRYADMCRHYQPPTVEDVLREMLCAWEDTLTSEGVDGIITEYAAKLRLAKEGE